MDEGDVALRFQPEVLFVEIPKMLFPLCSKDARATETFERKVETA